MRLHIGVILAAFGLMSWPALAEMLCGNFVVVRESRVRYVGDFDGDGKIDTLLPVSIKAKARLDSSCKVENPWGRKAALRDSGEALAFAIVHGGRNATTILHDAEFLATPIWNVSGPLPLAVVRKDSREFKNWKRTVRGLRSDSVALLTEAGIDILLYWNGKEYALHWPREQP